MNKYRLGSVKKFSTAVLLALAALLASARASAANGAASQCSECCSCCQWAPNAPDQHRVQRGDTLWDLASLFLENPWCWPRVWQQNQDLIRDPHWIFPGQVIVLDRTRGLLRLESDSENTLPMVRLSPRMRPENLASLPVPLISRQLQSLIAQSPLLTTDNLNDAPVISEVPEQRAMAAEGDIVFVRGKLGASTRFDVVRIKQALRDPDNGESLGMAGMRIGRVQVKPEPLPETTTKTTAQLHQFTVTASRSELQSGDRLMPAIDTRLPAISPHASSVRSGKLAAILHEGRWASLHDLVAINRGARDGLNPGSVVRVVRHVRIGHHENASPRPSDDEQTHASTLALLLVFDVAERVSLAAVMRATEAITVGDAILSAEPSSR